MDEFSFIEKYLRPLTMGNAAALNLQDDAAIIPPKPGYDAVITKDAIAEGTHFFKGDEPFKLAQKLVRVNISDLAAKGAQPYCLFLALALPQNTSEEWLKDFAAGLKADLEEFGCFLAGGDTTTHSGGLVLSLTAVGHVPSGKALLRSGAKVGDAIFATGTIGDSYLGLQEGLRARGQGLREEAKIPSSLSRYHTPLPRLAVGLKLHGIANATIDISDGLVADMEHICECSNVGAEIMLDKIPLSEAANAAEKEDKDFRIKAITGGDDYEILFTAPENMEGKITELVAETGVPITRIGKVISGNSVGIIDASGKKIAIKNSGYKHPVG